MPDVEIQGGCLCGKLRYRATSKPLKSYMCHCGNCRKACGGIAVAWLSFSPLSFSFVQGKPLQYYSSTGAIWSFCGNCGSTITYQIGSQPTEIDVTTVSVDDPEQFPPTKQFLEERLSWVDVNVR